MYFLNTATVHISTYVLYNVLIKFSIKELLLRSSLDKKISYLGTQEV